MALFDRLIVDNTRTQIVDLGYAPFEQFFGVLNEIGFVPEARRRFIEPIVLFVTDPAEAGSELTGPTRLWERWSQRRTGASPFGVILRPARPDVTKQSSP